MVLSARQESSRRLLYERWLATAKINATRLAVREGEKAWTFQELNERLAGEPPAPGPAFLQGRTVAFILQTLRAWRDGQIGVPLEDDATFDLATATLDEAPPETVHLKTTSGSSGAPRHILFTAEQLGADADQIVTTMGLRPEWPNIGAISLAHSYGFSNLVLPLVLHGIPLVLVPNPLPESMRQALGQIESATVPGVPAMWRSWHAAGLIDQKIKLAISAGAPLPTSLEHEVFDTCGVKIHNFLGASECGGIAYDRSDSPREADTTYVGGAMDGVKLEVDGALRVTSPAVGLSYWPEPDSALRNGTFLTSDLVSLKGNDVQWLGRADDVMNLAGRKLHPAEIENVISAIPGVLHCVVFGVPSDRDGRAEEIAACVHLADDTGLAQVKLGIANRLPAWKQPRHWRIAANLAPDARGKTSRSRWRAWFLEG